MVLENEYLDNLQNSNVYDVNNKKVGSVGQIYLDDQNEQPKFITVNTGLFGTKETFVPFDAAQQTEDGLTVPFEKDFIKDAPNIDADGHLSVDEERRIFEYYNLDYNSGAVGGVDRDRDALAGNANLTDRDRDRGLTDRDRDRDLAAGVNEDSDLDRDRKVTDRDREVTDRDRNLTDNDQLVAHEERLKVGTEEHEAGRARLRKRVRTETQSVEVPVKREELVVERETIDPNSREARTAGGISDTGDQEEVVTLREERPVVDKETIATEKVNVGKRTVSDSETVSGEVKKEEIDIDQEGRTDTTR